MKTTKIDKNIEPKDPEKVLFGLIFVSFGPLNIFPNIKPPMSEATQANNKIIKIIFKPEIFEKKRK